MRGLRWVFWFWFWFWFYFRSGFWEVLGFGFGFGLVLGAGGFAYRPCFSSLFVLVLVLMETSFFDRLEDEVAWDGD